MHAEMCLRVNHAVLACGSIYSQTLDLTIAVTRKVVFSEVELEYRNCQEGKKLRIHSFPSFVL